MSAAKRRLNIALPHSLSLFLRQIALRDEVSEATKARELLEKALELEEDASGSAEAQRRDARTRRWLGHDAFWSGLA